MPLKKNKTKNKFYDPSLKLGYDLLNNLSKLNTGVALLLSKLYNNLYPNTTSDVGEPILYSGDPIIENPKEKNLTFLGFFRQYANLLIDKAVSNDEGRLNDTESEILNLEAIKEYKSLLAKAAQINQEIQDLENNNKKYLADFVRKQNLELFNRIEYLNNFFQTEGKNSDVVASLMYDRNKEDISDRLRANVEYVAKNILPLRFYDLYTGAFNLLGVAENAIGSAVIGAGQIANKLTGGSNMLGRITRDVVKSLPSDDPLVLKLYRGGNINDMNTDDFNKQLNEYSKLLNNRRYEQLAALGEDLATQKTGKMKLGQLLDSIPFVGSAMRLPAEIANTFGGNYKPYIDSRLTDVNKDSLLNSRLGQIWQPENGTLGWKEEMDAQGDSILDMIKHPAITTLHTASSISMIKHSLDAMGVDVIISAVQNFLGSKGVGAMAKATVAYRAADVAKAMKDAEKLNTALKRAKSYENKAAALEALRKTLTVANVAVGINATKKARLQETTMERIQGLSERVYEESFKNGADLLHVFNAIVSDAQSKGIDTSKMDDYQLMQLGLALNTYTGDNVYEQAKKSATKGIMKLVNANNALAVKDFAQLMPWMSYGGRALNSFAKTIANSTPIRYLSGYRGAELFSKLPKGAKIGPLYDKSFEPSFNLFSGIINRGVQKVADRFFRKDFANIQKAANSIRKGLMLGSIGKWLKPKAKIAAFEGISEGIEEGQQDILQLRYKQGLYDDYNRPYDMFDTREIFDNINLAGESIAAWFGFLNDPYLSNDNIRKAMNIGFMSSLVQSGGMHAFGNISNNPDSFRNLVQNLKADKTMARLIGQHYQEVDDLSHLEFFYDALRNGVKADNMLSALYEIRKNIDDNNSLVKHEYVDNDIAMLNAASELTNNKARDKWLLKNNGISKWSNDYKTFVITGAKRLTSYYAADNYRKLALDRVSRLDATRSDLINDIYRAIKSDNQEETNNLKQTSPKLFEFVQRTIGNYSQYKLSVDEYNQKIELQKEKDKQADSLKKNSSDYLKITANDELLFVKANVKMLLELQRKNVLRKLYEASKNRKKFLDSFRRITGLDLDTTMLGEITDAIKDQLSYVEEREKSIFPKNNQEGVNVTYESYFGEHAEDTLDDVEDFNNSLRELYINDATAVPLYKLALPYMNRIGNEYLSNPNSLILARFGRNYSKEEVDSEDKNLGELALQYNTIKDKIKSNNELDSEYNDPTLLSHDIDVISEKAASHQIAQDIKDAKRRRYIANREWIEETPVTDDDINDAATGDEDAEEKVKFAESKVLEEADQEQLKLTITIDVDEETDAERELAESVSGRRKYESKTKAKIAENIKNRNTKTAEDNSESDKLEIDDNEDDENIQPSNSPQTTVPAGNDGSSLIRPKTPQPEAQAEAESDAQEQENDDTISLSLDDTEKTPEMPSPQNSPEDEIDDTDVTEDEIDDTDVTEDEIDDTDVYDVDEEEQPPMVEDENDAANRDADKLRDEADLEEMLALEDAIWVDIENSTDLDYDEDSETFVYDGKPLSKELSDAIKRDLNQSSELEDSDKANATWNTVGNVIANTFFYTIDPDEWDKPMYLRVNGIDVFGKDGLGTAHLLSERLLQKGWLRNATKYFIVTLPLEAKENPSKSDLKKGNWDNFTVSMIIESNGERYAVTLISLGTTFNEVVDQKTGETFKYKNSGQQDLIRSLTIRNIDLNKVSDVLGIPIRELSLSKKDNRKVYNSVRKAIEQLKLQRGIQYAQGNFGMPKDVAEAWWKYGVNPEDQTLKKKINKYTSSDTNWNLQHRKIDLSVRSLLALDGKKIMTNEQINQQINALRDFRNQIIKAYLIPTKEKNKKTGNVETVYKFPDRVNSSVKPTLVQQSNGTIDSVRKDGLPVYRKVSNESIDEIDKLIQDGTLLFGYGHGAFGEKDENGKAFMITGVREKDANTRYPGVGRSGKIYLMVKGPSELQTRTPVMLHEERFDYQEDKKGNRHYLYDKSKLDSNKFSGTETLKLCIDPSTNEVVPNSEYVPSAAEILLYMICHRLDLGVNTSDMVDEIVSFFINVGPHTLHKNLNNSSTKLNFLASKQISFGENENHVPVLQIAIGDDAQGYTLLSFKINDLFSNTELAEYNRKKVIYAISTQMHWDTELLHMRDRINLNDKNNAISQFISKLISDDESINTENMTVDLVLNHRVSIMGNKLLSFRLGDFFEKNDDGDINCKDGNIKGKDDVGVMAWMVANQKIETDASNKIFRLPFVYAYGVQGESSTNTPGQDVRSAIDNGAKNKNAEAIITAPENNHTKPAKNTSNEVFSVLDNGRLSEFTTAYEINAKRKVGFALKVPTTEEERQSYIDEINESRSVKRAISREGEGAKVVDRIFFRGIHTDDSFKKITDINDFKTKLENDINKFLDEYRLQYPNRSDKQIDKAKISVAFATTVRTNMRTGYVYIDIHKDGSVTVKLDGGLTRSSWGTVSGIYSEHKYEGQFDEKLARRWLKEKLGLSDHNVVVRNGVLRSGKNKTVFALTNIALDRITQEFEGYISLSRQSGAYATYHEAWHYVNMLLNDNTTRLLIWKDYVKAHPELEENLTKEGKKLTSRDIEEALAEAFVRYVRGKMDTSLSGRIKRLFNNVLDFVLISRRKSTYRQMFKMIQSGKLAGARIDLKSALLFKQQLPFGITKIKEAIPGYDKDLVDNLDSMDTHDDFFRALGAVIRRVMSDFNVSSIELMKRLSGKYKGVDGVTFSDILDKIDEMMNDDSVDDRFVDMLQDIKDNPESIRRALIQEFTKLGVKVTWTKGSTNSKKDESTGQETTVDDDLEKNEAKRRENLDAFQFDQLRLTVSKKENAALNTKIFFWSIPVLTPQDPYSDASDRQYVQQSDEFGTPLFYDFDKSWTKILSNLWMCTSLDDVYEKDVISKTTKRIIHKAGEYKQTSIFGKVKLLAKSDRFYQSVLYKLENISTGTNVDTQLRSQLFSTINSYKSQIAKVVIQDPRYYYSVNDYEDMMYEDYSTEDFEESIGQQMRTALVKDISRRWMIQDDSLISVERQLPRRWSKQIASLGLIEYDKNKGSVVSEKFVRKYFDGTQNNPSVLQKLAKDLNLILESDKKTKSYAISYEKAQTIMFGHGSNAGLKERVSDFLNNIGISMDVASLDLYIAAEIARNGKSNDVRELANVLKELLTNSAKSLGGIGAIKQQLVNNIGNTEFTNVQNPLYTRALDQLYNNYQSTSYLSRLAVAYNAIHPSSSEFSSKGPNGEIYYPINQNNYITDRLTQLNDQNSGLAESLRKDPYSKHSAILDVAQSTDNTTHKTNLRAEVFVGMLDSDRQKGNDYFGITPLEDILSKMFMLESDMLVSPTMADKKTWYAIVSSLFKKKGVFSHELLIDRPSYKILNRLIYRAYNQINPVENFDKLLEDGQLNNDFREKARKWFRSMGSNDPEYRLIVSNAVEALILSGAINKNVHVEIDKDGFKRFSPRFSDSVLNRFCGYFLDEIDALILYYDEDNIKDIIANPNKLLENFHGNINPTTGRMDFSGNGGKFRYFYDTGVTAKTGLSFYQKIKGKKYKVTNLNQILQSLYLLQQRIESENSSLSVKVKDLTDIYQNIGIDALLNLRSDNNSQLDGFELIRDYLKKLRKDVVSKKMNQEVFSDQALDYMNEKLLRMTRNELEELSGNGVIKLVLHENNTDSFINYAIPEQLLLRYVEQMKDLGLSAELTQTSTPIIVYSAIANFVANSAISTIEFEKVFSGDPAQYKERTSKITKDDSGNVVKGADKIYIGGKLNNTAIADTFVYAERFTDISSDKIKRLGSLLSPGSNIRTTFNAEELKLYGLSNVDKYSVLDVEDLKAPSLFIQQIKSLFSTQLLIDYILSLRPESFEQYVEDVSKRSYEYQKNKGKDVLYRKLSKKDVINMMYTTESIYRDYYESLPENVKKKLSDLLTSQMKPYKKITVADAQVFIRPDTYRRIRIGLGEWSFKPDETGYSDEDAYNIIENGYYIKNGKLITVEDGAWLQDSDLANKVAKFLTYPLKMSYFLNDSELLFGNHFRNRATLNKMAIFAVFKFHRSTNVGKLIYDRMNAKGNEIDMIAFKSAVKVGAVKDGAKPVKKDVLVQDATSALSEQLLVDDEGNPKYANDKSIDYVTGEEKLNSGKNTLAISVQSLHNLRMQLNTKAHELDERNIGSQMFKIAFSNVDDFVEYGVGVSGRSVRLGKDIKRDVMNSINLMTTIGAQRIRDRFNFKNGIPNRDAVLQWLSSICISNGLGTVANLIISQGCGASSLMSRTVFENSASAYVNDQVVGIETLGGTAIQQSMFGFAKYGNASVSLQITLGGVNNYVKYNNGEELKWNAKDGSMQVLLSANFFRSIVPSKYRNSYKQMRDWLIRENIIGESSKPFGIGYRIPTQGLSSMFVMQVADILPQQSSDTIIVPREFTAQTGSDFKQH